MTIVDRRSLLRGAAAGALLGGPFAGLVARAAGAHEPESYERPPLEPIADLRDGQVRLWLPRGFQYRSFHDTETPITLDDGTLLPGRHDGMAAFKGPRGTITLVRNHEVNGPGAAFGPGTPYDPMARGGTTTVQVTGTGEVLRSYTSLNGTQMNCSGGPMPWGSWVSCEETVNGPDVAADFTGAPNTALQQRHGFIFEVPADGQSDREPITAAGRFAHESVAWDPREGALYLTEDNFGYASGFYRYLPPRNHRHAGRRLADGGRLQMLAVRGTPNAELAAQQTAGTRYRVRWVDIDDPAPSFPYEPGVPAPTTNDTALTYVGNQGRTQGAAHFSRLEGAVYDRGVVYFCSTQGGGEPEVGPGPIANGYGNGTGQVWGYDVRSQTLEVVFQSPDAATLDFPDNITTSPRGTLILCEDNVNDNFVRGLTKEGRLFDIALNRLRSSSGADRSNDEFAGSTFSPDGRTLFVNIQASAGMTFAIWGPWGRLGV